MQNIMDAGIDERKAHAQTNQKQKCPPDDQPATQEISSSECSPKSSPQKKDSSAQENSIPHDYTSVDVGSNSTKGEGGQYDAKNNKCCQEHCDDQDNASEFAAADSQEASSMQRENGYCMEEPTEEGSIFEENGCGDEISRWMQRRLGDDSSIILPDPTAEDLSNGDGAEKGNNCNTNESGFLSETTSKRPATEMSSSSLSPKLATKRRQRSHSTSQLAPPDNRSPSRRRMDDVLCERSHSQMYLRDALLDLEKAKAKVRGCRSRYNAAKARVENTAKEECDALLQEDTPWNEMFHKMKEYKEASGDCNVKQKVGADDNKNCKSSSEMVRRLLAWVGKNRKDGKLQGRGTIASTAGITCKATHQLHEGKTCEESDIENAPSPDPAVIVGMPEETAGMPPGDVLQHEDHGDDSSVFGEVEGDSIRADPYKQIALDGIGFDWDPRNSRWNSMYKELRLYKDEHGNTLVPRANFGLGAWVKRQQVQYTSYSKGDGTKSELTEERVRLLNDLGFVWSRRSNTWNENFQRLAKWKEIHGSCHIPDNSKDPELVALNKWMADQRVHYKRQIADQEENCNDDHNACGEKSNDSDGNITAKKKSKRKLPTLSQDKISKLQSVDFEFDSRDAKWLQKLDVLMKYKQKAGDFLVPSTYPEDPTLSNWVASQRAQYKLFMKGSKSHMTERRLKILTGVLFPFSVKEAAHQAAHQDRVVFDAKSWLEKYKDFLLYIATRGSLESLQKNNPFLAEWVSTQREERSPEIDFAVKNNDENTDNPELKEHGSLMEAAHFFLFSQSNKAHILLLGNKNVEPSSVNKEDSSWDDQFGSIAAWYIKHGSYAPKGMPSKLKKFASRCTEQHRLFASGLDSELTSERIEKLEDIFFPLDKTATKETGDDDIIVAPRKNRSWEEYRLDLAISYLQNSSFDVNNLDDAELRRWAAEQKRQHKMYLAGRQTSLTFGQIQKLVDIKFISKRPKQISWPETCCDLMAFRIQFGTFDVASAHVVSKGRSANPCTALKNIQEWVLKLRGHYCESSKSVSINDELTQDRKMKLDSVGFPWTGFLAKNEELPDNNLNLHKEEERLCTQAEGTYFAPIKSNLFGVPLEMQQAPISEIHI